MKTGVARKIGTKESTMIDKELKEYSQWMWAETAKMALQAVVIYGVLLGAYWLLVG
jgi:hypothetical protein